MGSKQALVVAAAAIACSSQGQSVENTGVTRAALSSAADILGFEVASAWHTTASSSLSDQHSEGAHSFAVRNVGWAEIVSDPLPGQSVASSIAVDILLPTNQPNPHWYGDLSVVIDAPSVGLYSAWVGQRSLNGLPLNTFNSLEFSLPPAIVAALSSAAAQDLRVKLVLNVPYNSGTYLFDRLRLAPGSQLPPRDHRVACSPGGLCTFITQIPATLAAEDVALSASGSLTINDGVQVMGPSGNGAAVVVSGGGPVNLGVETHVGSVVTDGPVALRSRALVDERVFTSGTVTQQDGVVVVDGITSGEPALATRKNIWDVAFPVAAADVNLEPDTQRSLAPGAFRTVTVKSRSTLALAAGAYTFESISLEPQATLLIENEAGPTKIGVRSSMTIRGRISYSNEQRYNVRFSFAGTSPIALEAPFLGTLVAPAAKVTLATVGAPGHRGAIFAKQVEAHQWSTFEHRPFRDEVCEAPGQCRPIVPSATSVSTAGIAKTLTWKTAVPIEGLAQSFQAVHSLQSSCRTARDLCLDTLTACAENDPSACNDQSVCSAAATACAPLYLADAAPGSTGLTDPVLKFLNSSEVSSSLGIQPAIDSLRFAGTSGQSLVYKHYVDAGNGTRVPVLGSQVVVRPGDDEASISRVSSTLQGSFSVPLGALLSADAAIGVAVSHVNDTGIFDIDRLPAAEEASLVAVREGGLDRVIYSVPFRSPALPDFVGGRVMVDGKTGAVTLAHQVGELRKPVAGDFAPILKLDPRLMLLFFQNLACQEDGHGLDRFGSDRSFSTTLLPTGVEGELVYGTVSCDEVDNFVDPPLRRFDVATFVPAVQEDLRTEGFVPIEDAYKMVYTEQDNEFFESSPVEAQFWGAKVSQYYRRLNGLYGVGGSDADYRVTPDGNGLLPRIRMLSVTDFPGLQNSRWFPPVLSEKAITASNGIAVFGAASGDNGLRAWSDPGVIAHEFFHSVIYDHIGIIGQGEPGDAPAISEGLADCFEMLATHEFGAIMSQAPGIDIDPFHLKQGVFEDEEAAFKGEPSLANPLESAVLAHEYWAGQRTADTGGHKNSTLISGVCKLLITGGFNPVLGGNVEEVRTGDMAVVPLPWNDPGQTSLTQSHQDPVVVNREENWSHLEELLVATVQSGKITRKSTFRDVIEAFATTAEEVALKNKKADTGRWEDNVPYYFFDNFVRMAFSAYGWGRLVESEGRHGPGDVAPLRTTAMLNLIGANEANPEPIEGCVCGGDQDFFVLNERVRFGDTIHFEIEGNGQLATRIFVRDPCRGFDAQAECPGGGYRYAYPGSPSDTACKTNNQLYPEDLCAQEDPENVPQSGSVRYEQSGTPVVFIGISMGPMGGDRNYKLKAWIHHEQPLHLPLN